MSEGIPEHHWLRRLDDPDYWLTEEELAERERRRAKPDGPDKLPPPEKPDYQAALDEAEDG